MPSPHMPSPHPSRAGISGMAVYLPRPRVDLRQWSQWTGANPAKTEAVVGRSFRLCGPDESVYTMAASAVLRLIDQYGIDPESVGMLVLATESSTDNSAGAIIVKGMVDRALIQRGTAPLSRRIEVPEVKHACLGGIYALKQALRYIASDGAGRAAIVVASDIAEYARGSSGEPTQGAGAVAWLVDADANLMSFDLSAGGNAAAYRGADFRKPVRRHFMAEYASKPARPHDFPVFNGAYSTFCYLDAVRHAFDDYCARTARTAEDALTQASAFFMHRPYHWMPIQALSTLYTCALASTDAGRAILGTLATEAGVSLNEALAELNASPDLYGHFHEQDRRDEPAPSARNLTKKVRSTDAFRGFMAEKVNLGTEGMKDFGNLYTAALPAWMAVGLDDAFRRGEDLSGREVLVIGYGSGDAAEVLPAQVSPQWREAASKIQIQRALDGAIDLDQKTYEALHDGIKGQPALDPPNNGFMVTHIGTETQADFQDIGLEYYRFSAA